MFYVWFDAPIGYISITAHELDNWKDWWHNPEEVKLYQFMAKDNIPFHTVIFPASLLGTGKNWTMLHHINATEYLNYENTKFSKSRNIGVFGDDVKKTDIHVDLWRFYLLANRPERNDTDFVWDDFIEKVNSEFIDNIGNMVNRTIVYLNKNFDGIIRDFDLPETHEAFVRECILELNKVTEALEAVKIREAIRIVLAIGNRGNKFFQDMQPWEKIKTDKDHAHATVSLLTYLVNSIAIALSPYMPESSQSILAILNRDSCTWKDMGTFRGLDGHQVGKPEILHKKLDPKAAEKFRKMFSGALSDFGKLQLKTGRILDAENHPDADQLYKLTIDLGEEAPRTLVAGLKKAYALEELKDRKAIVLANLKPAKLRGILSNGMILVCKKRNKIELLDASPFEPGQIVEVENQKIDHSEITLDDFSEVPLEIRDGILMSDDQKCTIGGKPIETHHLKAGKVC